MPGRKLTSHPVPTIDGPALKIVPTDSKIKVSDAEIVERDIYASNGVLHTVNSLLLPPNALQLTPEKYLLALNCTEFVSLIHSVNLTHMINDMNATYTILAPRDDVIKIFGHDELPHRGSEELKRFLLYHFIPGKWSPKKFENGMLVETALEEAGLAGGRQVMNVEVDENKGGQAKAIRFAGAGVMGDQGALLPRLSCFSMQILMTVGRRLQSTSMIPTPSSTSSRMRSRHLPTRSRRHCRTSSSPPSLLPYSPRTSGKR